MLNKTAVFISILSVFSFTTAFGPNCLSPIHFSSTILDASLRPSEGVEEISIPADGTVDLGSGCTVSGVKGRYYCTAEEDGTTYIGDSDLTAGVNYLLSNGMKIKTASKKEFDVLLDDMSKSDPMMKMMFESMRSGFLPDIDSTEN